ncbi:hypothetical protein RHSIM_Rhsim06G0066500 [Rhododendron simsii]|uniref:Uncharacterized protein n=1 Tax=Rhododendron simsii TaxID=118357 RepID=A0A834GWT3_RHOSS|nr:hypothetical protein RHSIM_Rhsim06G0066500 [Rhododendron simsii]
MYSSNSNTEPSSRFPNLKEVNPDFGLGEPLGFGKLAFSSTASGWSRPRLVKLRKPKGRMETGKDDSGFNPLNTNVENSSGFVGNRILDAMGKLRFGSDQLRIPCVFKGIGIDKNAVSKLPEEIGKLNIEGSANLEWFKNLKDVNFNLASEFPNELKRLNIGKGSSSSLGGSSAASILPEKMMNWNVNDATDEDLSSPSIGHVFVPITLGGYVFIWTFDNN